MENQVIRDLFIAILDEVSKEEVPMSCQSAVRRLILSFTELSGLDLNKIAKKEEVSKMEVLNGK